MAHGPMLPVHKYGPWPHWGKIDMMKACGTGPNYKVQCITSFQCGKFSTVVANGSTLMNVEDPWENIVWNVARTSQVRLTAFCVFSSCFTWSGRMWLLHSALEPWEVCSLCRLVLGWAHSMLSQCPPS